MSAGLGASAYKSTPAIEILTNTAGAGQDNVSQNGVIVDRTAHGYPTNGMVSIGYKAVLAAGKKLTLKNVKVEHGDAANLSDAADLQSFADADVKVDGGAGGTYYDTKRYVISSLSSAKRYIRFVYTADLDASGTDTVALQGQYVFDPVTNVA